MNTPIETPLTNFDPSELPIFEGPLRELGPFWRHYEAVARPPAMNDAEAIQRARELDAKASKDWSTINHETYCGGMGCTPDGCCGHDTGVAFNVDGPQLDPECDGPSEEGEAADKAHWAQCDADAKFIAESRTLLPDLANRLEVALARVEVARKAISNGPHAFNCSAVDGYYGLRTHAVESECDCWKKDALAQLTEAK